ncbi:helix-turn-helix domain-containing protein [Ruthenibacterium lactatiformans]|uniref:helix-turn-helix domain-containing protein n=1 Tax=Ruthenibacterium lactatiformans TaxID=1550024 RepID=UPI0027BB1180|nr:helix-turn-helix transcriptional regulator [Ruthenibacterium lactatiformans]
MDYVTLGKNIRKYRLIQGLKQDELAEQCGCSNSHIGQIENARGIPSLDMVVKIANSLSVTVDQLLKDSYANPEMVYLREVAERIENYPVARRIQACEGLMAYLDSLEKFSQ